jgi:hypothetical protein
MIPALEAFTGWFVKILSMSVEEFEEKRVGLEIYGKNKWEKVLFRKCSVSKCLS